MGRYSFPSVIALLIAASVSCHARLLNTQQDQEPVFRDCGGIVEENEGMIEYKMNDGDSIKGFEQCIWTIRTNPPTTQIEIKKTESHFSMISDNLMAYSVRQGVGIEDGGEWLGFDTQGEETFMMNGSVVILVFTVDVWSSGRGFRLFFRGVGEQQPLIRMGYDLNTPVYPGSLVYPGPGSSYKNYEMSTFVVSRNYTRTVGSLYLSLHSYDLENSSLCFYDGLIIYGISTNHVSQRGKYCGTSNQLSRYSGYWAYIIVLYSDSADVGSGFNISWEYH